jgi:hypothetical protein
MIGIPNFKLHRLAVVSLLALTGVTRADEVTLEGDARLEGKVTAILDGGATRLDSPLSAEPLTLRAGSVKKVVFADSAATPHCRSQQLARVSQQPASEEVLRRPRRENLPPARGPDLGGGGGARGGGGERGGGGG